MAEVLKRTAMLTALAQKTREAAAQLALADTKTKNAVLKKMADGLRKKSAGIVKANSIDLKVATEKGRANSLIDRLMLNDARVEAMAKAIEEIIALPDPVGEITGMKRRPNGLLIGQMRIPLGVILIIYEARPNVTADAAALCVKSGNGVILRGGSESINSNRAIGEVLQTALVEAGMPREAVAVIPIADRAAVDDLLKMESLIDLVIPRGGEDLIRAVVEKSRITVLKHYKGVCHVFVDENADYKMAEEICFNAKVQRPGVCNAMETLLVHERAAKKFLPKMAARYKKAGVEIRGCAQTRKIVKTAKPATEKDWYAEYLDLILAVKVVAGLDEAVAHIRKYGSDHTESIVTESHSNAMRFLKEVSSSTVMVNASTRFSDGGEFGLGAEIGISTTKLHAYGPMGLESLTGLKYIVFGNGQVRA